MATVSALLLTAILSVDLLPRVYEIHEGDVAAVPIKAPRKASYVSQIRTRAARDAAAAQVPPVVELDRDKVVQQTHGLADLIQVEVSGCSGTGGSALTPGRIRLARHRRLAARVKPFSRRDGHEVV